MTEKIKNLLSFLNAKEYKKLRVDANIGEFGDLAGLENQATTFRKIAEAEKPVIFENDSFGFNRHLSSRISVDMGNITPNYYKVIGTGFDKLIAQIKENIEKATDEDKKNYGKHMLDCIDVCLFIADRYKEFSKDKNQKLYNALCKIPHGAAESFYEACLFMKLSIYCLRLAGVSHLTLGRFDQYMYPFYLNDKKSGVSDDEILEIIEEFFISINYDTDIYHGVQQGDNGQSMVLGGFDADGNSVYNELTKMCLAASLELSVIDPKINLRVGKNTPIEIYEFATHLTKQGLGFPQYCNDDVVVPGLVKLGYDKADAVNYTVAACWEYIIPNCGADYPNIATFDFPGVIHRAIVENLEAAPTFDALMGNVEKAIATECENIIAYDNTWKFRPQALLSVFMDGCIEKLTDMWYGASKYNNFGCHGTGIANAADALAAVKKTVYEDKTVSKTDLLKALETNFEGYAELRNLLRNSPKMGNNEDFVDDIACDIMRAFSTKLNNKDNGRGGIWRAGTGSAMEYLWKGERCPATADGRLAFEPYSSSYSPSLDIKTMGILSVIQSFTKYSLEDIINGGPLTIEIHDTVFRNDEGIKKTAMLVKSFIDLGGHQLQLNSVNRDILLDAQKNPEKYQNLIVRVWGWSGYFNELDVKYQNHIIRRCEYTN